jgi:RND family efflux transporter MFP subunit
MNASNPRVTLPDSGRLKAAPTSAHRRTAARTSAVLFCTALIAVACSRQAPSESTDDAQSAVAVAAQTVDTGTLRAVVQAGGLVVPAEGAEFLLVAPESARVLEITKAVGDTVASGEVLVRLELPGAAQELARQRADVASAQARLENARSGQTRTRDFVARGLVPRLDLDAADRELSEAQAAADRAEALFKAAENTSARGVVRAPFAGIVATRLHNPGDLVQPAVTDPILRIVDPRRMEVAASVAPADAARVLPGASARIANPADGTSFRLSVLNRAVASAATGGLVPVRLLPSEPLPIALDTPVAVEIDAEERTGVVFVSPDVVIRDGGQMVVMVAVGERAERRLVTTGLTTENRIEIVSGLTRGELVITQGQIGLADGARINVVVR